MPTSTNDPAGSPAAPSAASPADPGNTTPSSKDKNNPGPFPNKTNTKDVALKGSTFEMAMELFYNNKGKELAQGAREFFGNAYDKLKKALKPAPNTADPADKVAAVTQEAAAAAATAKNRGGRGLEEGVEMSEITPQNEEEGGGVKPN